MSSTIPAWLSPFLSEEEIIVRMVVTVATWCFGYGIYILIFGACIHLMRKRRKDNSGMSRANHNLYLSLIVILFVLSTSALAAGITAKVRQSLIAYRAVRTGDLGPLLRYASSDDGKTALFALDRFLSVLLNITADIMLIHRCHLIWSSRKRITVPLVVLSASCNGLGLVSGILLSIGMSDSTVGSNYELYVLSVDLSLGYDISSAIVNVFITFLTAGRIWWIHRQCRVRGVRGSDKMVESVSRIILESGLLYPFFSIVTIILTNAVPLEKRAADLIAFQTLSAAIAPTLVIVRAKLGKNVESLQNRLTDIQFTSQPTRGSVRNLSLMQIETGTGTDLDSERSGEQRLGTKEA